jgi:hypothetical protein
VSTFNGTKARVKFPTSGISLACWATHAGIDYNHKPFQCTVCHYACSRR